MLSIPGFVMASDNPEIAKGPSFIGSSNAESRYACNGDLAQSNGRTNALGAFWAVLRAVAPSRGFASNIRNKSRADPSV